MNKLGTQGFKLIRQRRRGGARPNAPAVGKL